MNQSSFSKKPKTWLSLSEAADILGVHFTTLRRWADAGDIECMRTPGGRRRFNVEVIVQFLQHHQQTPVLNLPTVIETRVIDHTRRNLQKSSSITRHWIGQFNDEQKTQFRQTGSRLTALLMQYSNRAENGGAFLEEGKRISAGYGTLCYQAGLPITETIQAFLFFRRSILDAVHETDFLSEINDAESHQLYQRASFFFDEMLMALVSQYFSLSTTNSISCSQ
uniref:Helix-turn-helix domain-containing protein n=1 Tax=Anaerolinea thermolimosa TaxID=229919 RepID=A0A7C4PUS7_9CHLR